MSSQIESVVLEYASGLSAGEPRPLAMRRAPMRAAALDEADRDLARPLLLIVDDDAVKARLVRRLAIFAGWRTVVAPSEIAVYHVLDEHERLGLFDARERIRAAVLDDDVHGRRVGERLHELCVERQIRAVVYSGSDPGPRDRAPRITSDRVEELRVWLREEHTREIGRREIGGMGRDGR